MGTITKPNTFSAGGSVESSEHNSNYDTIYNEFNGNIENVNVKTGAGILASKVSFATMPTVGATSPGKASFTNMTLDSLVVTSLSTGTPIFFSRGAGIADNNYLQRVYSSAVETGSGARLGIYWCDNAASTIIPLEARNDGPNAAFICTANGNGAHISMVGDPTVASPADGDMWFDGTVLKFRVGAATKTIDWT